MKKATRFLAIVLLFIALVLIRFFASALFYDPLIAFYKGNTPGQAPPDFSYWHLMASTSMRFALNASISLSILYLVFREQFIVKFSALIYAIAWAVLILCFGFYMSHFKPENYFLVFYIRRFLIQPLFIILLLPAFYYQKVQRSEKEFEN